MIENRHKKFVQKICKTEEVLGLSKNGKYAVSKSVKYETDDSEPVVLICFWAEKARAKSCIESCWNGFEISSIPLAEFIENWCWGIHEKDELVGTAFDSNLFGYEIEPLDLAIEIIDELIKNRKEIKFSQFESVEEIQEVLISNLK
jgi:hypothetical protein